MTCRTSRSRPLENTTLDNGTDLVDGAGTGAGLPGRSTTAGPSAANGSIKRTGSTTHPLNPHHPAQPIMKDPPAGAAPSLLRTLFAR